VHCVPQIPYEAANKYDVFLLPGDKKAMRVHNDPAGFTPIMDEVRPKTVGAPGGGGGGSTHAVPPPMERRQRACRVRVGARRVRGVAICAAACGHGALAFPESARARRIGMRPQCHGPFERASARACTHGCCNYCRLSASRASCMWRKSPAASAAS
jgi:hypothetical protein